MDESRKRDRPRPRRSTANRVMMWRSRYRRTNRASRPAESGVGLPFLSDQREDFVPVVEEIAEGVEDLSLGDPQRLGDLQDRFAAAVQGGDVADGHAQPVDHGLAAADAFEPDD